MFGIHRLAGLGVLVALAVAVGVDNQRGPPLRLLDVAGLVEHLGVDPADIAAAAAGARPDRFILVVAELEVMRAEAGLVGGVFAGLGIIHRHPAIGAVERKLDGGRMRRALLAEVRIVRLVTRCGEPQAALPVEHRVVIVRPAVPDVLLAPVGRRLQDFERAGVAGPEGVRHVGRRRQHEVGRDVLHHIEDRHVVAGMLALAVDRTIGIDGRVAPVAGDQVVQVLLRIVPVTQRDDDVAFDTLRPGRLRER